MARSAGRTYSSCDESGDRVPRQPEGRDALLAEQHEGDVLAGLHGDSQRAHRRAAQLLQRSLQHVMIPDAHPSAGHDGIAPGRGGLAQIRQDILVICAGAEIDAAESVGSELGEQGRAVGVADLPRQQRITRPGKFVAGGQDAHRGARAGQQRLDAKAREHPDMGGPELGPWREDLGPGGDVLTGMAHVHAGADRGLDEDG